MRESVTYQVIVEEGRVEEGQRIILRQGRLRFGPPDRPTTAAVESITDVDRLEALSERLLEVGSWAELLASAEGVACGPIGASGVGARGGDTQVRPHDAPIGGAVVYPRRPGGSRSDGSWAMFRSSLIRSE